MAEYSYRLLNPRSYLSLFYSVFFGNWAVPEPDHVRQQAALISQALILTGGLTILAGWIVEISTGQIDWQQAAFGVAGGIAGGVVFGVAGSVAFGVAGGIAFGVAFGVSGGVAVGVSLWSYEKVQGLAEGLLGSILGLAAALAVAAVIFSSGIVGVVGLAGLSNRRKRPHQWSEWLEAMAFFLLASLPAGWLLSWLSLKLNDLTTSPVVLTSVFVLMFTRLPLWPAEAVWSGLSCWRLRRQADQGRIDGATMARGIRRAGFDRQMILPLPGEVAALWRLSKLDETLAIGEAAELARWSNHRLTAIAALRKMAATNPLVVRRYVKQDSYSADPERTLRYTAYKLPEAAARVWTANELLTQLAEQVQPQGEQAESSKSEPDVLQGLRQVTDAFAAALSLQSDLRHVDTHLALYRAVLSALEAEAPNAIASFQDPELPSTISELYQQELLTALEEISTIARRARGYVEATSPVTQGKHLLEIQAALEKVGPAVEKVPNPAGAFLGLVVAHWRGLFARSHQARKTGSLRVEIPP